MEELFSSILYDNCYDEETEDPICSFGCFTPMITPTTLIYNFNINQNLNGIYHTLTIKNTCLDEQIFVNKTLYKDTDFEVKVKAKNTETNISVLPGATIDVDIIFIGTKSVSTILNIPFVYETILMNNYKIVFNETVEVPNNKPIITNVVKVISNRTPYNFTLTDFTNHFIDVDGDILEKIVLLGDVSRFTIDDMPYLAGTIITRDNISLLKYTPLDSDTTYDVIVNWKAYDSRGAENI